MMAKMYDRPYVVGGGASSGPLQSGRRTDTKEQCDRYVDPDELPDASQHNQEGQIPYGKSSRSRDRLALENVYIESETRSERHLDDIVGRSDALRDVLSEIETVAPADSTVLIYGETGTGKELIARAVHNLSSSKSNAFVKLNCAAIPTGLQLACLPISELS